MGFLIWGVLFERDIGGKVLVIWSIIELWSVMGVIVGVFILVWFIDDSFRVYGN